MRKEFEINCEWLTHDEAIELSSKLPKEIGKKSFVPVAIIGNSIRGYIK